MRTWRALTRRVEKRIAATGTGQLHISIAANCAPPANTRVDISATSATERPLLAAIAPKRPPIGIAATITGAMSRRPSRAS